MDLGGNCAIFFSAIDVISNFCADAEDKVSRPAKMATTPTKTACLELNRARIIGASLGLRDAVRLVATVQHYRS
jgi:hypothetical protein